MSHKWTCDAVGRIPKEAMIEVVRLINTYPLLLTYDNINIPFRVFSQRLDNQGEFGNCTDFGKKTYDWPVLVNATDPDQISLSNGPDDAVRVHILILEPKRHELGTKKRKNFEENV